MSLMIEFYIWKATIPGHLPIPIDSDPQALSYADNQIQDEPGPRKQQILPMTKSPDHFHLDKGLLCSLYHDFQHLIIHVQATLNL